MIIRVRSRIRGNSYQKERIQGHRKERKWPDTGREGYRVKGIQGERDTGVEGYRGKGIQGERGYRGRGIQGERYTG